MLGAMDSGTPVPVIELNAPIETGNLSYNLTSVDRDFTVAVTYTGRPATGSYVFNSGSGNNVFGIRDQGSYYWFAQSQYYETKTIATGSVSGKKVVLTHVKGSNRLYAYDVNGGVLRVQELGVNYRWNTGTNTKTYVDNRATNVIIYESILAEEEIKSYLGLE